MTNKAKSIPEGYNTVTPYLFVHEGFKAIEFYKNAFGAKEQIRMDMEGGKVGHAELLIGDSKIMLADECPQMGARSAKDIGASPVSMHLYVDSVDEVVAKAVSLGATLLHPVENQFYGDRTGNIKDPFGHVWYIATHIEDLSHEETQKRAAEWQKQNQNI